MDERVEEEGVLDLFRKHFLAPGIDALRSARHKVQYSLASTDATQSPTHRAVSVDACAARVCALQFGVWGVGFAGVWVEGVGELGWAFKCVARKSTSDQMISDHTPAPCTPAPWRALWVRRDEGEVQGSSRGFWIRVSVWGWVFGSQASLVSEGGLGFSPRKFGAGAQQTSESMKPRSPG